MIRLREIEGTNMHDQIVLYVCQSFLVEVQMRLATHYLASLSCCPQKNQLIKINYK